MIDRDWKPKKIVAVRFYKSLNGNEPVKIWLKDQTREDRRFIGEDIKTIEYGWPLGMPLVRKMESNLWEVRCRISKGIARVLFTVSGETLILLHGFIKKSQKIPLKELEIARRRLKTMEC